MSAQQDQDTDYRKPGYPFDGVETFWQAQWEKAGIFHADRKEGMPKWFIVELPPFANGQLHLGHARNYTIADASARFRRMAGYNVLYTTGFDTFGLPNETAAREEGCTPEQLAERSSHAMARQFVRLGLSHDRRRITAYHDKEYYRWVQWVFLKLHNAGYCFRQKARVNWCPRCNTSLAESLVEAGRCWRCQSAVETRVAEQWFVREVDFADAVLAGLPELSGWPETIKRIHVDWIGRRDGIGVRFRVRGADLEIEVFFDNVALLAGTAFVAIAVDHPAIDRLVAAGLLKRAALDALVTSNVSASVRHSHEAAKNANCKGLDLGIDVELPLFGRLVPLIAVPTNAVPAADWAQPGIPAHRSEERRLALEMGIPWGPVLQSPSDTGQGGETSFDCDGSWRLVNSQRFDGLPVGDAQAAIAAALSTTGAGAPTVRYRLRDWSIARQRYWGPPVPMVHCDQCGIVPVPEEELPVILPLDVDLSTPGNPLEHNAAFLKARCPRCAGAARRDTETLEAYSSPWWYHWICKSLDEAYPFASADARYWLPVDVMIGGADQARTCFFHIRMMAKALTHLRVVEHDEPVDTLLAIGMVKANGRKMSKSSNNSVGLDDLIGRYGADALRLAILSAAAPERDFNWSEDAVKHQHAFLTDLWNFVTRRVSDLRLSRPLGAVTPSPETPLRRRLIGWLRTAQFKVTESLLRHHYHLAAQNLAFLFGRLVHFDGEARLDGSISEPDAAALAHGVGILLRLLAPLAPHIAEELWSQCKGEGLVACARWPMSQEAHRPSEQRARLPRRERAKLGHAPV